MSSERTIQLLIPRSSWFRDTSDALRVILSRGPRFGTLFHGSYHIARQARRPTWKALFTSGLLHFSLVFFFARVPLRIAYYAQSLDPQPSRPQETVYKLQGPEIAELLAALQSSKKEVASRGPTETTSSRGPESAAKPLVSAQHEASAARWPLLNRTLFTRKVEIRLDDPDPGALQQVVFQRVAVATGPQLRALPQVVPPSQSASSQQLVFPATPKEFADPEPDIMREANRPAQDSVVLGRHTSSNVGSGLAELDIRPLFLAQRGDLLSLSLDPGESAEQLRLLPLVQYGSLSRFPGHWRGVLFGGLPEDIWGGGATEGQDSSGSAAAGGAGGEGGDAGQPGLPAFFENLVYRIPPDLNLKPDGFIITAGPAGGGGLRTYGVLSGDRVYTVSLAMPGQPWTLQYCEPSDPAGRRSYSTQVIELTLDDGLVAPVPQEQYDFQRPLLDENQGGGTIILKGFILIDGSVGDLKVFQGIDNQVDRAAMAAFSRWKFQPACRGRKPVVVEILLGIPATPAT